MHKPIRATAILVACAFVLTSCHLGTQIDGLPAPPGDTYCQAHKNRNIDKRPPATPKPDGPACRHVKEFRLWEASRKTEVDLEYPPAGGIPDLLYNHITGNLTVIHGAIVALWDKPSLLDLVSKREPRTWVRSDFPGEQECQQTLNQVHDGFNQSNLEAKFSIFCIKTAEGHNGFLFIKPINNQKPNAYHVYSYIWVR